MNEQELFSAAIEQPPDQRSDFLDQNCRGDHIFKARLERLLALHAAHSQFLCQPASAVMESESLCRPESSLAQIGPYRLREVLGEGGMGIVYLAEQEHPIRRNVALKLIKPGMDSREVIARLDAERQALALMDHPNIAKLLDAGTIGGFGVQDSEFSKHETGGVLNADSRFFDPQCGRPYFVMELVRGLPITEYCDQVALPLRKRLELFITVCRAVQHAHQKAVIHRDLKPSNVMITLYDGVPVPKVIDFGVAKALNQRLTDHTLYTRHAQLLGTPLYMSPEQAELSGLDVDTRSDVYSLGVLLYELLTGRTPFDKETLAKAGYDEVRRMIRDVEPSRPSQKVSTLGQQYLSTVAHCRGVDERQLSRSLRGELDWIAMKALEKDRTRRYGSADALASDLQNWLDDRPVQACPPSATYRLRKAVQRQRALLGAIGLAVLTGVIAAAVATNINQMPGALVTGANIVTQESLSNSSQTPADESESKRPEPRLESFLPGLIPRPPEISGVGRWQLITKLPRSFVHQNWKLAWSPDSRRIGFGDGNDVRIYSVPELELVQVCSGHTSSVVAVAWSPDGTTIASCSIDNSIRLWDEETGVAGAILAGHQDRVDAIAWHPDSMSLASGSRDATVRLWNRDGTTGQVLRGHTGHVYAVAWNQSGTRLASTGEDGAIVIWSAGGKSLQVLRSGQMHQTIDWSPDGDRVLTSQFHGKTARLWTLADSTGMDFEGHSDVVTAAALSPDGQRIASASWDDTVRLWDIDGNPREILRGFAGNVYSVAWSPDGQWIAAAGVDRRIRLFQADGRPGPVLAGSPRLICLDWQPDGEQFAASLSDGTIRICNSNGEQQTMLAGTPNAALTLDWTNDGRQIVGGYFDRSIRLWDVESRTVLSEFQHTRSEVTSVVVHPHLPRFAIGSRSDAIGVWETDGTKLSGWWGPRGHVYEAAWNPLDGDLAVVGYDGKLRLWNVQGSAADEFTSGEPMTSVAWKSDGTLLATGLDSGAIQLWQPDGRPDSLLKGHSDRATSVAWSDDGLWLASGSRDNTVRIWTADGQPHSVLYGHVGQIATVRWEPRTSRVLSGSSDGTVRLWSVDAEQPEWISIMLGEGRFVRFDPAGRLISGEQRDIEREFAYLVERPRGAIEVISPWEFERRRRLDASPPMVSDKAHPPHGNHN